MQALRARSLSALRLRAGPPVAAGKKGGKKAATAEPSGGPKENSLATGRTIGANIHKEGSDPPHKPDSEYPAWVFKLTNRKPPLSELRRKKPETLTDQEVLRLLKLSNRQKIKEANFEKTLQ
ncbi:hypothetical protein KFL_007610020 [Klebsormidium nitens]|uniref:Large ribosomal subunit protein mL54 n=1 Tax=Klebsormidium nitens TaxID=105231 RepID=A0A1Y1IP80_KLENI|nr:hypothetical protein KFL_007610020 [Klebsormidium nitens]|eukprot:GAQ91299.1 hypothetical protein KFL_007610020 [Klebsormidium nitens]